MNLIIFLSQEQVRQDVYAVVWRYIKNNSRERHRLRKPVPVFPPLVSTKIERLFATRFRIHHTLGRSIY